MLYKNIFFKKSLAFLIVYVYILLNFTEENMERIRCRFGIKRNEIRYEIHKVFKKDEINHEDFPEQYVSYEHVKQYIWRLEKGYWIETVDGYIAPIIGESKMHIRIPGIGNRYYRSQIATGKADVYFDQPDHYYLGKVKGNGGYLSSQQKIFCWVMAQSWDMVKAIKEAGYSLRAWTVRGISEERAAETLANRLLEKQKIRDGVKMSIKMHLEALNMGEEQLVLNKRDKLMQDLGELQQWLKTSLIQKVSDNQPIIQEEVVNYLKVVNALSEELNTVGEWLGYGKEQSIPNDGDENINVRMIEANISRGNAKAAIAGNEQQLNILPEPSEEVEEVQLTPEQILSKEGVSNGESKTTESADDTTIRPVYAGGAQYPIQPTT